MSARFIVKHHRVHDTLGEYSDSREYCNVHDAQWSADGLNSAMRPSRFSTDFEHAYSLRPGDLGMDIVK